MNGRGATKCSTLEPFEVERVESSTESFLRDFPMLDMATGTFKHGPRQQLRKERAAYRLAKIEKQRAELEIEERLLRAELSK